MKNSVRLEFRKMHRLHSVFVVISLVVAVAALSSASLFSSGTRETFNDPAAAPWAALLLSYTMMAAMTSPILTAVLASRQTDIEHPALGWILAATAGRTAGGMCRAKLVALTALLFPATVVQSLLVIGLGNFAGIGVPFDALPWAIYTLSLFALNVAFCALHIWLAARVENQLISMGVGMRFPGRVLATDARGREQGHPLGLLRRDFSGRSVRSRSCFHRPALPVDSNVSLPRGSRLRFGYSATQPHGQVSRVPL